MNSLPQPLAALEAWPQFIAWKAVWNEQKGKFDKLPCDPANGSVCSAHDRTRWRTAREVAASLREGYGIAFVFTSSDPFFFLDIDNAWDGQAWSPFAQWAMAKFAGAAVEVSTSGKGLHIFGTGQCPQHACKNVPLGIELYTEGRFVALTGTNAIGDSGLDCSAALAELVSAYFPDQRKPVEALAEEGPRDDWNGPEDDSELIRRAYASKSASSVFGAKASFADLWEARADVLARAYPGDPYDASSADRALAQHLAFWTGCDEARIERLMRQSKLVRDKWEREDYLPRTISGACAAQIEVLQDRKVEAAPIVTAAPVSYDPNSRFIAVDQQAAYFSGCVYVQDEHRVLIPGGRLVKPDTFKALFAGATFPLDHANEKVTRNAWEAFIDSQAIRHPRAITSCFRPDLPPGAIVDGAVNTWAPDPIERIKGDATPFLKHLEKILPDPRDQLILMSYMCAVVQYPGVKFQWAPLLQGAEGNGKTLFSRCVAKAVGERYVHWPKASKINAQFNAWLIDKIFIAVEDIVIPEHKADVINELKPMITGDDGYEIEKKGVDQVSRNICCNFMLNCNPRDGLRKTKNDRRFCVFFTAQQSAADIRRDGMGGEYFPKLYKWLRDGGYAIVNELLYTWQIPEEFNPARDCQRAPDTSSTDAAIAAGMGTIEQEIMEIIEQDRPGFRGGWVSMAKLDETIIDLGFRHHVKRSFKHDLLIALGYIPHPGLPDGRVNNPVLPDGVRTKLYVTQDHPSLFITSATEIAKAYTMAQNG